MFVALRILRSTAGSQVDSSLQTLRLRLTWRQLTMRRQRVATGFLRTAAMQMATTDVASDALNILYDVCACVLALLLGAALMKLLRDYTRRKGYIEIQQDDRNMYSNVLLGTSDSWENARVVEPKTDDAAI